MLHWSVYHINVPWIFKIVLGTQEQNYRLISKGSDDEVTSDDGQCKKPNNSDKMRDFSIPFGLKVYR